MTLQVTLATARRILTQLRRDHRTLAMLFVAPVVLLILLRYVYNDVPQMFEHIGAPLLALFPFITMFLVTSVAMLRERTSGTLERLLTTPLGRGDLVFGYALAFGSLAVLQSVIASAVALGPLGLHVTAGPALVTLLAVVDALLGMALGLFLSAFARTEFQAVQFLPAVVLPQLLLCGLLVARKEMATPLQWLADVLPLTYAVDGMQELTRTSALSGRLVLDLAVVAGASLLALTVGAATLRRRSA